MPELNLRSIEQLVTILLVLVHPKCEGQEGKTMHERLDSHESDKAIQCASLVSSGIVRCERRFAPGGAPTASRRAAKMTAIWMAGSNRFRPAA
jgi:hypothetical protein